MKKGFTLLELILVVVIMGVVYMFAIGSLQKVKQTNENALPTPKNLKKFLLHEVFEKKARFVCYDNCEKCDLVLDGKTVATMESFFQRAPKTYRYDATLGMVQTYPQPYFNADGAQEQVCFSYMIHKNGIGEQIYLEYNGRVYDYSDYLDGVKVYNTIEEIQDKKESLLQKVLS